MSDPVLLAFEVIPVMLAATLAWGAAVAWRRAGAGPSAARSVGLLTLAAAAVWMAATWVAAASGVLANFEPTPPPFAFLVLAIAVLAVVLASWAWLCSSTL